VTIDRNEFFRETTLRLCRHLRIEEGLRACVEYLAERMPADGLYLESYDPTLGAMRVIARGTPASAESLDVLIPLPDEAKAVMDRLRFAWKEGSLPPVSVINRPEEEPATLAVERGLGLPPSSALGMALGAQGRAVGNLALLAEGDDRYTPEHVELFGLLAEPFFVAMSNTLEHREVVKLKDRFADDTIYLSRELQRIAGDEIVGSDLGLRDVMRQVGQVAPTESPVMLTGETGVGKDVIANAIHLSSPRRDGPFIAVNCGAIPEALLDSELFGHERGAFTGALTMKRGRFERADKGTILLDEIGEMPLDAQVHLLRVLQNREVERIGGTQRIELDIRVVAATNKNLEQEVRAGRFREDLYFRLNVFPIVVPPLRERLSDVPALVEHFIEKKAKVLKLGETPRLAEGAIDELLAYDWPGNVRELENVVERAMILHRGEPLRFDGLTTPAKTRPAVSPMEDMPETLELDAVIKHHIERVLEMTGGKIHGPGGAGEVLAVNANTLRYKMKKLGIPFGRK